MTEHAASFLLAVHGKTGSELRLALQELVLTGEILPVGARLRVRHTFRSAERKTLEAVCAFLLPADSAGRQRARQFLSQIEARGGTGWLGECSQRRGCSKSRAERYCC